MAGSETVAHLPTALRAGNVVRFVSPASTPERAAVLQQAAVLENWGLAVDFGAHAFHRFGYLAGTDEQRVDDVNQALRDPNVRAIIATRGGKGSYRIADDLDFEAARRDPKPVVGFSDITILHLNLWKRCGLVGIHGGLLADGAGTIAVETMESFRAVLTSTSPVVLISEASEPTSALTTDGIAEGRLLGGNLNMISAAAGWALPRLDGAILLIEAANMGLGQIDRELTMLRKSGYFNSVSGIAVGQFTGIKPQASWTVVDVLREHLERLNVPTLGGLPIGHGAKPRAVPLGTAARLDARSETLTVSAGVKESP